MRPVFAALVLLTVGCGNTPEHRDSTGSGAGPAATGGSGGTTGLGGAPTVGGSSSTGATGGGPATPAETDLPLSPAPAFPSDVVVRPNRSSVILELPAVEGAWDYRVFAVEEGVTVSVTDNRERIDGGTLHCAGLRQRNQCNEDEILPVAYNTDELDLPLCQIENLDRRPDIATELMHTLEVDGVGPDTTLVVEAIDRQCPFPGVFGTRHEDVVINASDVGPTMVDAVVEDQAVQLQRWQPTFPLRTQDEIRADYGSMILNGQGPNQPTLDPNSPNFPESPYVRLGQPAPADDPVVLARSVIKVNPIGTTELPPGFTDQDYFDDFSDPSEQPEFLRDTDYTATLVGFPIQVYTTKKWVLYDVANEFSDFFIDRGQLNLVFGDTAQGSMTHQGIYPKRPAQLPSDPSEYLHVTYEVQRNETPRRYENFSLCGADEPGQTYDGETPKATALPRPGFMNEGDTARTNALGWNCLLLVPRGAGYWVLPGGDVTSHTDSSLKITVVDSHPAPTGPQYDGERVTQYAHAFGPTQEDPHPKQWFRQVDGQGEMTGMWLDDMMNVWQRSRFDVYIRRDRVVIYVEGQQRICQDLTASPLTMAEGAIGFWHILYHTSAEFMEVRDGSLGANPSTGQHHIMHNTPFADQRTYDNMGFRENVTLPDGFDESVCDPGTQ